MGGVVESSCAETFESVAASGVLVVIWHCTLGASYCVVGAGYLLGVWIWIRFSFSLGLGDNGSLAILDTS